MMSIFLILLGLCALSFVGLFLILFVSDYYIPQGPYIALIALCMMSFIGALFSLIASSDLPVSHRLEPVSNLSISRTSSITTIEAVYDGKLIVKTYSDAKTYNLAKQLTPQVFARIGKNSWGNDLDNQIELVIMDGNN